MMGFVFLLVIALVFAVIWINLAKRPGPRARTGPEGTKVGQGTDVELAEEVMPALFDRRRMDRNLSVSRATTKEPGPGEGGPEGGDPDLPVEQPDIQDDLTDIPNGEMPAVRRASSVIAFRPDFETGAEMVTFRPEAQPGWGSLQQHDPLPAEYAEDGVTAIVRNPRSLYAYWEKGGGGEQRLRAMLGDAAFKKTIPCLRLFDVSTEGAVTIDVGEQDDHWFINNLEPGHRYVLSFERRTEDGRYYLLSLSSPVSTPAEAAVGSGLLYEHLAQMSGNRASSPWR